FPFLLFSRTAEGPGTFFQNINDVLNEPMGERMFLRSKLLICCITTALGALAVPSLASAQAPAQTSSLNGRVTDAQGAALANAEVSLVPITPAMRGMKMTPPAPLPGRVSGDGTFVFPQVPAGQYVLQIDAPGYSRSSQEVTLPTTQNFSVK